MALLDDILQFIAKYNALMAKNETQAAMKLAAAYQASYKRIAPLIAALAEQIAAGELTAAEVRKLKSLAALENQLTEELTAYSGYLRTELGPVALVSAKIGADFAASVLKYLTGGGDISKLSGDNLDRLMAWFQPGSALYERIGQLAPYHTQQVIDAILEAVGRGLGPRQVAAEIIKSAEGAYGAGLVDALRMSRTTQLWAGREATRANYIANQDIITGWIWVAELDADTCMSCVALHGQRFDLDEVQDDHYNGRCTMIPEIMGTNPVEGMQGGEDWFLSQPESVQQQMMGPGKFEAWQGGQFGFNDLSQQHEDDVYGTMRGETTLQDLVGKP
jgi:hypothetical protein